MSQHLSSPSAKSGVPDPFGWLEDIDGVAARAWVDARNRRTADALNGDPRYETFRAEALAILTASDRIAYPSFLGGDIDNLWQDGAHVKGLWRRTSPASYRSANPQWETLLDLDALSRAEGRNWIWKGTVGLPPTADRCLVRLSDGGGDAVEVREFDTRAKAFVADGFHFPPGKQIVVWLDRDTLLLARDWGPGTLTASGYPFVVKQVRRGEPLDAAREVWRGSPDDVRVFPQVLVDGDGAVVAVLIGRSPSFFSTEFRLLGADGPPRLLDLPPKVSLHGWLAGRLIVEVNERWRQNGARRGIKAGSLAALDLSTGEAAPLFVPTKAQAIAAVRLTRDRVLVSYLDDVSGRVAVVAPHDGGWRRRRLRLPSGLGLTIVASDPGSDLAYVVSESFLEPACLWELDAAAATAKPIRRLPSQFDASRHVVEQAFAVSSDGTRVPYFLVRPVAMERDGSTPVEMFGYGGFQIAETPSYRAVLGKLWLERGGAYVLTNIRGGGEYGPAWHEAALRERRQLAFDDFAAIARDLIDRKITSPRRLGIYGRSNGGVLTSVSMTQHPELFGAVVIESPLIDMLGYHRLSAGASWVAEYGNPEVAADRVFIARYSAYANLRSSAAYPEPYITTNTLDDRVHPGHARKFAALLETQGHPCLYFENAFGGHANDADPELNASRWARHYVYLARKLMD